jgi:hypothetical protein
MQWIEAKSPGPKYAEWGTTWTSNVSARIMTRWSSVTPPIFVTLGCAYVIAPASNARRKSQTVP